MYIIVLYDNEDIIEPAYDNKVFKTKEDLAKYVVLDDFLLGLRESEDIQMEVVELEINK